MRSTMGWGKAAAVVVGLVLGGALPGVAQFGSRGGGQLTRPVNPDDNDNPNATFETKRVTALNADRHKAVVSDTEKLVKLARQLDAEIASNPSGGLTPEELRKLDSIEKLAHTVKAKMAESFGGGPEIKPIFPSVRRRSDE